jgi:DNA-binding SARP family transcriptional activator/tetratricopeptide (TPR) repeat protein
MSWQLNVLGEASLVHETSVLRLERKTVAVLTYLALEGTTHRSKLAGLLWSDSDEKTARNNLAQVLRRLKKATDAVLVSGDDVLRLTNELSVDAAKLKVLSFEGNYQELLTLGGELLATHDYDDCPDFADWLFAEREGITALRKDALTGEMLRLERSGEPREALEVAEALLHQDTLSEEAHRQIMRLHYVLGDRAAALKAFERCQTVLEKELGVEPTRETQQLAKQIEDGKVEVQAVTTNTPAIPLTVLRPPLVGRDNELARLAEAWKDKKIAFLRGEPGVGKSRLIGDFLADKTSVRVEGRPGDTLPFASYTRAVRQWLRHHDLDLPGWVKRELSRLDPSLSDEVASNDTLRLSEAVTELLRLLNANKLQAVAMDDLQFMDTASFELSRYLLSAFVQSDLRMLASYRSGEVSDETSLMQFVQAGQAVLVDVNPLNGAMTSSLLERIHLPELKHLGEAMQRSTGGNPMFIIETIKHLIENKRLDISPDKLPNVSKVSSLIQKRLEQLSPAALRLAQVAAVAGTEFELDLASQVLETHLLELAEPFAELENKQVMRGQAFVHDLLFESTVASIPAPIKTLLDLRIARVLNNNGQSAKAASHYLDSRSSWQTKDNVDAVKAFTEVAKSISASGNLQQGAVWFERGLEVSLDKPMSARILTEQARLLERYLRYDEAATILDKAEQLALTADAVTRAGILNIRSYLSYVAFGNWEQTSLYAKRVLELLEHDDSFEAKSERAMALSSLGVISWEQRHLYEAERFHRESLGLRRQLGNIEKIGDSLINLGIIMIERSDKAGQTVFEEAVSIWEKTGHQANLARTLTCLGYFNWKLNQLTEAESYLEKAIMIGSAAANQIALSSTYNNLGIVRFSQGNYQESHNAYRQALDCPEVKDNKRDRSMFLWNLTEVDLRLANLENARANLTQVTELAKEFLDVSLQADAYWLEGDLNALEENFEAAKESYQNCLEAAKKSSNTERTAEALARLARLEKSQDLAKEALALADTPASQAALYVAKGDYELARETIATTGDTFEEARLLLDIGYLSKDRTATVTAKKLLTMLNSGKRGSEKG